MTPFKERMRVPSALVGILVVTALVYLPGIRGGYVFDDYPNIVDNLALHVTSLSWNDWIAAMLSSPASNLHRPLAMLTFAVNLYFTGLDPVPMKLTNIAIHLLNVLLVFGLIRSLLSPVFTGNDGMRRRIDWAALFASACWALHPINLMAVLFIVQRMESLCHVFVFAGLWAYVAGRVRQQRGASGWSLVLTGLVGGTAVGLLAKESAVLLPVYALCLETCIFGFRGATERRDPRMLWLYGGVLILPAIIGVAWLLPPLIHPGALSYRNFTIGQRLLTEPRVVLDYLRWILLPDLRQFGLDHDDYVVSYGLWNPPSTLLAILGIVALSAAAWFLHRRRPLVSLGILWFLSAQLLTATFIPLELVFEHRNYFASLGICVALADLLLLAPPARSAAPRAAATAFVLLCATTTYMRASEWSNPVLFASTEAAKHPLSPRSTYSLARALVVATRYNPNSPLVAPSLAALDHARHIQDSGILPDQAALLFDAHIGRPIDPDLWTDMQAKLSHDPIGAQEISALRSLTDCAVARKCMFDPNAMLATFWAAMGRGDNPYILHVYGNYVLNVLGDDALAMRVWKQASMLAPNESQYRISVIKLLIAQGKYDEARADIAALRGLGGLSQHATEADVLDKRLSDSLRARSGAHPSRQ
jgi:hypothetical protein